MESASFDAAMPDSNGADFEGLLTENSEQLFDGVGGEEFDEALFDSYGRLLYAWTPPQSAPSLQTCATSAASQIGTDRCPSAVRSRQRGRRQRLYRKTGYFIQLLLILLALTLDLIAAWFLIHGLITVWTLV